VRIPRNTIQDRRAHSRLPVHLDCEFVWENSGYRAQVMDISLSGAFVSSRVVPPVRSPVKISLTTPKSKRTLVLEGKVARPGRFVGTRASIGFSVRFDRVTPEIFRLMKEAMAVSESQGREQLVAEA